MSYPEGGPGTSRAKLFLGTPADRHTCMPGIIFKNIQAQVKMCMYIFREILTIKCFIY